MVNSKIIKFDWEAHYAKGGESGDPEEYKLAREWKYFLLDKYYTKNIDSILDVGCGDLQFWGDNLPYNYTGIDISQTIIDRHKRNHPDQTFICSDATKYVDVHADVVICFDMLWHIIDDVDYINILKNIKQYSNNYIYIYTWNNNPFESDIKSRILLFLFYMIGRPCKVSDGGGHQKYRDYLSISKNIFEPDFKLIETYSNNVWKFGSMYIYKKITK
jgi:SAM-dependent methyltransferase